MESVVYNMLCANKIRVVVIAGLNASQDGRVDVRSDKSRTIYSAL